MNKHTYDFGIIGNCVFMAHVKTDTRIVWMCWPRFDSSFVFGSLLDDEKGANFPFFLLTGTFNPINIILKIPMCFVPKSLPMMVPTG